MFSALKEESALCLEEENWLLSFSLAEGNKVWVSFLRTAPYKRKNLSGKSFHLSITRFGSTLWKSPVHEMWVRMIKGGSHIASWAIYPNSYWILRRQLEGEENRKIGWALPALLMVILYRDPFFLFDSHRIEAYLRFVLADIQDSSKNNELRSTLTLGKLGPLTGGNYIYAIPQLQRTQQPFRYQNKELLIDALSTLFCNPRTQITTLNSHSNDRLFPGCTVLLPTRMNL